MSESKGKVEHTHVFLGHRLGRRLGTGDDRREETFLRGDPITPTATELLAFSDLLCPMDEWPQIAAAVIAGRKRAARAPRRPLPETPPPQQAPEATARHELIDEYVRQSMGSRPSLVK